MENQQHEGHRGLSSSLVLSDLLMLDLVVAGLQGERYLSDLKVLKRLQTKQRELHVRYLEGGEHNAVFSVLDAGVHQVFDQTDLRTEVPDTEERKKKKKPTFESDLLLARHVQFLVLYQGCDAKRVHHEVPYVDLANGSH